MVVFIRYSLKRALRNIEKTALLQTQQTLLESLLKSIFYSESSGHSVCCRLYLRLFVAKEVLRCCSINFAWLEIFYVKLASSEKHFETLVPWCCTV
jgi:hypothetical protein